MLVVRMDPFCETEVTQSGVFVVIQEHILRLDVSVDNAARLKVIHCFCQLPKDAPLQSFIFKKRVFFEEVIEGLPFAKLHLNVQNFDSWNLRLRLGIVRVLRRHVEVTPVRVRQFGRRCNRKDFVVVIERVLREKQFVAVVATRLIRSVLNLTTASILLSVLTQKSTFLFIFYQLLICIFPLRPLGFRWTLAPKKVSVSHCSHSPSTTLPISTFC